MNWSAALMKDGGKPMGPTPAEKKKAEEREEKGGSYIEFCKDCIMRHMRHFLEEFEFKGASKAYPYRFLHLYVVVSEGLHSETAFLDRP